jgi:hypothetical protein
MADARYEEGDEGPLRLIAQEAGDLPVLSALLQDAVLPATEMRWEPKGRRFAALVNRFRWEDRDQASRQGRGFERVRSLLTATGVLAVKSQSIDRHNKDQVLSILALDWAPGQEGAGVLTLVLAGDGAVALEVEALDLALEDVSKPYLAPSRKVPDHGV